MPSAISCIECNLFSAIITEISSFGYVIHPFAEAVPASNSASDMRLGLICGEEDDEQNGAGFVSISEIFAKQGSSLFGMESFDKVNILNIMFSQKATCSQKRCVGCGPC